MASRTKTRDITITESGGAFSMFFKKFGSFQSEYDFESLSAFRKLLSNEKARMLHIIKTKKPSSIYNLAKILKRDFKSVMTDVKLLERFGFVDFISEKSGKREKLRPVLAVDTLYINFKI